MTTTIVKAQVEAGLKLQAEETLKALGLDMTSALRMFLHQVVIQRGIPFDVSLPQLNRETLTAIADSYAGRTERFDSVDELFASLEK